MHAEMVKRGHVALGVRLFPDNESDSAILLEFRESVSHRELSIRPTVDGLIITNPAGTAHLKVSAEERSLIPALMRVGMTILRKGSRLDLDFPFQHRCVNDPVPRRHLMYCLS
ncbi:MAG: hypothetical protein HGA31_05745 [Candidatus Moranbacteria bacterium]|nr:hypothetical protein [Candidatus Moranbacteria bacterium]